MIIPILTSIALATAVATPVKPDPRLTPGATMPGVTIKQICQPSWVAKARKVSDKTKLLVYKEYGVKPSTPIKGLPLACCEIDHDIPLELGGSNSILNLWPEPYLPAPGAHEKDQLENKLHRMVCKNEMDLGVAQKIISQDWYKAYQQYVLPAKPKPSLIANQPTEVNKKVIEDNRKEKSKKEKKRKGIFRWLH